METLKCPENCNCPQQQHSPFKCKVTGVWLYENLPNGLSKATENDFRLKHGMNYGLKYLAKSFYDQLYHAYVFTKNTNYNELLVFIKAGKIFIKKEVK